MSPKPNGVVRMGKLSYGSDGPWCKGEIGGEYDLGLSVDVMPSSSTSFLVCL